MTHTATSNTDSYLIVLFTSVNRLVTEFYDNTLCFDETLNYTYVINTITAEAGKIMKNHARSLECCSSMNESLRQLEPKFIHLPHFRQIIRGIIIQNELYMSRNKNPSIQ